MAQTEEQVVAPASFPVPTLIPSDLARLLSKEQIVAFLGLPAKTKVHKTVLLQQLESVLTTDQGEQACFLDVFVQELAIGPGDLEACLSCTSTERKRWISEGKLPVLDYRSFHKAGQDLHYPVHDRRVIFGLTQEQIAQWRTEHQTVVAERRKTGAQVAQSSRKTNQHAREELTISLEEMVASWEQQGSPQLAATFRLAFWTQWASRWAKENHIKNLHAIKHNQLYQQRRDAWYARKDAAMRLLATTPYARISFYRPEDPDKRSLTLCDKHYETKRELSYPDKWSFYTDFAGEIHHCNHCKVMIQKDYYSLYSLEITAEAFPELRFSFHMPYPLGKMFLPAPKKLPKVEHNEQDGIFRFGRPLFADEKLLYREKDVEKQFEHALEVARGIFLKETILQDIN